MWESVPVILQRTSESSLGVRIVVVLFILFVVFSSRKAEDNNLSAYKFSKI